MFSHFLRKLGTLTVRRPATVRAGGLAWVVAPEAAGLFDGAGPDLPAWLSAGTTVVVKQNLQRTIYRVRTPRRGGVPQALSGQHPAGGRP
ncbi:MAG: hypothetical protein U0871_28555 [Gemmataceae bacterium]